MSIESVMPSSHLFLCHPLLFLPSIFPSIRLFSKESVLRIRWLNYWSFSFSISPSSEHPGLISFRMDWLNLLAVQGTLKSSSTPQFQSIHSLSRCEWQWAWRAVCKSGGTWALPQLCKVGVQWVPWSQLPTGGLRLPGSSSAWGSRHWKAVELDLGVQRKAGRVTRCHVVMEEESERTLCPAWLADPWEEPKQGRPRADLWGCRVRAMRRGWLMFGGRGLPAEGSPQPPPPQEGL